MGQSERNDIDMVVPEGVKKEKMNLAAEELEEIFPKDYKDSKDVVDEESHQREEIDAEVKSKQEIKCKISNVEDSENEISQEVIATKVKDLSNGNESVQVQKEKMEIEIEENIDNKQGEKDEENEDEIILKTEKTGDNIILKEDQSTATEDKEQITKEDVASYSEEEKSKSP